MGRDDQGIQGSETRYKVIPRTLCFVTEGDDVLLLEGGPHKRLWAGRHNGVGGHVESGEDIYAAARRELFEETGLSVDDLQLRCVVHADAGDPRLGILFFVFTAAAPSRQVTSGEEGTLAWWPINALPTESLVEDLPILMPRILAMKPGAPPLFAAYHYDAEDRLVIRFAGEDSE